jgi:hypothetical protein
MSAPTSTERLSRMLSLVPWLTSHDGVTIDEAAAIFPINHNDVSCCLRDSSQLLS